MKKCKFCGQSFNWKRGESHWLMITPEGEEHHCSAPKRLHNQDLWKIVFELEEKNKELSNDNNKLRESNRILQGFSK